MNKKDNYDSSRWMVAIMGTVLQLCLGTVYAWSFFQKPLVNTFGWTNTQVAWTFSFAICFLGLAAAWGGINLPKYGPQKLAVIGGLFYGLGYLIAACALHLKSLPLLYFGFGVVGGIGLGLGYVTPVATSVKWFPDKKGFITGMVIMGFGLGALVMSKLIAPYLMSVTDGDLIKVFALIGVLVLIATFPAGMALKNPPADFIPKGWKPEIKNEHEEASRAKITIKQCLFSSRFIMMWLIFFFNITAGIMFIGFQSPMLQDLLKKIDVSMDPKTLAAAGATLIAISSIFNGIGRFFWGWISDHIGRIQAFRLILSTQIIIFAILPFIKNPIIFGVFVSYVLLCYGGGFGTMPSFVHNVFGHRLMSVVYGCILTAWSMGGIVGPQIVAFTKDNFPSNAATYTFGSGALLLLLGFFISLFLNNNEYNPHHHANKISAK